MGLPPHVERFRRSPELDSNPRQRDLPEPENPPAVFSSRAIESKL
jgi:hypothetical protein